MQQQRRCGGGCGTCTDTRCVDVHAPVTLPVRPGRIPFVVVAGVVGLIGLGRSFPPQRQQQPPGLAGATAAPAGAGCRVAFSTPRFVYPFAPKRWCALEEWLQSGIEASPIIVSFVCWVLGFVPTRRQQTHLGSSVAAAGGLVHGPTLAWTAVDSNALRRSVGFPVAVVRCASPAGMELSVLSVVVPGGPPP